MKTEKGFFIPKLAMFREIYLRKACTFAVKPSLTTTFTVITLFSLITSSHIGQTWLPFALLPGWLASSLDLGRLGPVFSGRGVELFSDAIINDMEPSVQGQ